MYNKILEFTDPVISQSVPIAMYAFLNAGIAGVTGTADPKSMAIASVLHMVGLQCLFHKSFIQALSPFQNLIAPVLNTDLLHHKIVIFALAHFTVLTAAQQITKRFDKKLTLLPAVVNTIGTMSLLNAFFNVASR